MSWDNFKDQDTEPQEQVSQEPKKLTDSVKNIDNLSIKSNELASKILSDIDTEQTLSKQLINLNITEVNKNVSKETLYKTEEDKTDKFIDEILNHDNNDLFRQASNYSVSTERKKRYDIYEQILDSNYIAFRILRVFINNVLIKNAQTKNFLTIQVPDEKEALLDHLGKEIRTSYEKFQKSILMRYKLQRKLKDEIVPKTLLFGNYFMEVVDLNLLKDISKHEQVLLECDYESYEIIKENNKEATKPKTEKILKTDNIIFESNFDCFESEEEMKNHFNVEAAAENQRNIKFLNEVETYDKQLNILTESDSETKEEELKKLEFPHNPRGLDLLVDMALMESVDSLDSSWLDDINGLIDNETKVKKKKYNLNDINRLDFSKIRDIHINGIHPKNVIIIQKDGLIYGYLVVDEDDMKHSGGEYIIDSFKRLSSGLTSGSNSKNEENELVIKNIVNNLTDEVLKKVVSNIKLNKKRSFSMDFDYFKTLNISNEATSSLKLLMYHKLKSKSKLRFRFLTPESMINFSSSIDKFAPYGTSVFDPIVGPVKLYTLALMSSVVSRLSRAAVMRKWTIETGNKRNHKEIVDKTKAELKSKAITFDKINSLKNISEVVTDFKDMATVSINGQRFIDMEILPMHDRGLPLNDLTDLRNDIISGGGVPAVYLNIGDGVDLRETLVQLNVTFANEISEKQQSIEDGINDLNDCLFKKVLKYNDYEDADFNISNYSNIKLNPPLVLQIQSDEAMITTVSNIVSLMENAKMAINPKKIFQNYIPGINWDKMEKEGNDFIKAAAKQTIIGGGQDQGGM